MSKQYHIRWRKCQKYFYVTHWQKKLLTFLISLSLYIFTLWKCIAYNFLCRDGIYFDKKESTIRLIICTVAFGLGVNIPDVRFVVHLGACDSPLQYWQEVGRAGRDGNKAKAYMYTTKSSIVHINDDMKNICNGVKNGTISCCRKAILNCMIPGSSESNFKQPCTLKCDPCECDQCFCCSICMATCPCNNK